MLFLVVLLVSTLSCAAPNRYPVAGPQEKYRVLVDKVLMRHNKWVMTEQHIKEIKAAGFNIVCPRIGGADMARVRRVSKLAGKHGLFHVAWMRGSRPTKTGLKYLHADGRDQTIYSPNADELWDWMTELILGHARVSTEVPAMIGTFLDFENYAPGKPDNCYSLSYDDKIMGEFAAAKKIALPILEPAERYPWLRKQGLHNAFQTFQIDSWRARCRKLREQIDAINPRYLLIVYPGPGTFLVREAAYPTWATEQAPLILADACTYGRPSAFLPHASSLMSNRGRLGPNFESARASNIPFIYMGGIDPVCKGADPEFCAKNAVMISELTDGYWVFYEGPDYEKDHPDYFAWFKRANTDIAAGQFALQHEERSEPENLGEATVDRKTDKPQIGVYSQRGRVRKNIEKAGTFEAHALGGMSLDYLSKFDVVLLQNYNVLLPPTHEISRNLRAYVEKGGGLLFGHDTAWFMESIFPNIAVRDYPKNRVEAKRHVVETDLVVAATHPAIAGLEPGQQFKTEFRDHMIFKAGPAGTVLIRNTFGDPVYVAGTCGKGRVIYSGCYYAYRNDLSGLERKALLAIVDWLNQGLTRTTRYIQ